MRHRSTVLPIASFCLAMVASGQVRHTVSGRVLDDADKPLAGARIEIHRADKRIITGWSQQPHGRYSIEYDGPSAIDLVRYDYSGYVPDDVHNLSSSDSHKLVKTLLRPTQSLTMSQIQGALCTFERLAGIDVANDTAAANADSYKYGVVLDEIGKAIAAVKVPSSVKDGLNQRLNMIKAAYRLPAHSTN